MERKKIPFSRKWIRWIGRGVALGALAAVAGCGKFGGAERPAWRAQADAACFARRTVEFSDAIQPLGHEIDGPSICGLSQPLRVTALLGGRVLFNSTQTLDCPMVEALEGFIGEVAQPAALARFGQPIVQINSMGSYNCRGMNNQFGARLSEHAFGNALDIGGFVLADGRKITIAHDWTHGDAQAQAFLRDVHNGACDRFTTVLSPGSNPFHYNHIHADLAMHGMTSSGPRRICKPRPQRTEPPSRKDDLPDAPEIEDDLDIAQGAPPRGVNSYAMHPGPDLAATAAFLAQSGPSGRARRGQTADTRRDATAPKGGRAPEGDPASFDLPAARAGR